MGQNLSSEAFVPVTYSGSSGLLGCKLAGSNTEDIFCQTAKSGSQANAPPYTCQSTTMPNTSGQNILCTAQGEVSWACGPATASPAAGLGSLYVCQPLVPASPILSVVPASTGFTASFEAISVWGTVTYSLYRADQPQTALQTWNNPKSGSKLSYTDNTATACQAYQYYLTTVSTAGTINSGAITVQPQNCTPTDTLVLNAPTFANGAVGLTWQLTPAPTGSVTYTVYRTDQLNNRTSFPVYDSTSYNDATVTPGSTYNYLVTAAWDSNSLNSNTVSYTVPTSGGGGGGGTPTPSPTPTPTPTPSASHFWWFVVAVMVVVIIIALVLFFLRRGKSEDAAEADSEEKAPEKNGE